MSNVEVNSLISLAEKIARSAHEGQSRKNGRPFTEHLESVVSQIPEGSEDRVVAWLHDVLEDTLTTAEDLRKAGIPPHLVQEIEFLTKKREHTYTQYIEDLKGSETAVRVKKADIVANLGDNPGNKQMVKLCRALISLCGH